MALGTLPVPIQLIERTGDRCRPCAAYWIPERYRGLHGGARTARLDPRRLRLRRQAVFVRTADALPRNVDLEIVPLLEAQA